MGMIKKEDGEVMDDKSVTGAYHEHFKSSPEYQCLTKGHDWYEPPFSGDVAFRCRRCNAEIEDKGGEEE
jgi:hypothetical protein